MAVFITLCKCSVKIIYNHFKTWLVLVNISSRLNMVLRSPVHTHTFPTPSAHPSMLKQYACVQTNPTEDRISFSLWPEPHT